MTKHTMYVGIGWGLVAFVALWLFMQGAKGCEAEGPRVQAAMYCYDHEDPRLSDEYRTQQFRTCMPVMLRRYGAIDNGTIKR